MNGNTGDYSKGTENYLRRSGICGGSPTSIETGKVRQGRRKPVPDGHVSSMKNLVRSLFLLWLTFISIKYLLTALHWIQHPFNRSPFDLIFSIVLIGVMGGVSLGAVLLKKRGYLAPLFLGAGAFLSMIVLSILSRTLLDLLIFLWLMLLSCALGRKTLDFIWKGPDVPWVEKTIFSVALGFGCYSFFILGISVTGLLYPGVVLSMFVLVSIVLSREMLLILKELLIITKGLPVLLKRTPGSRWMPAFLSVMVISFLVNYMGAIAPEIQFDALDYHLAVPRIYIENHSWVELPGSL